MSDEIKTSITIRREDLDIFTVHDAVKAIGELVELNDEQKFRITAITKRLVHYEKLGVYSSLKQYFSWKTNKEWFENILKDKIETHEEYSKLPDEQIVTWSVGSHKYGKDKS